VPSAVVASTVYGPTSRPVPCSSRTLCDSSRLRTDDWSFASIDATRSRRASKSMRPSAERPIARARSISASAPPVAIIALLGMQSHRCAAPPMMSRSIMVTSAPRLAATVAAVLPAGPPPMITKRTDTSAGYDRDGSRKRDARDARVTSP
jgi:hypothetical protein